MRFKYASPVLIFLLLHGTEVMGQSGPVRNYYFGTQVHYGFIIPHSTAIEDVADSNPYGIELSLNKLDLSYEGWSVYNRYSVSGIQLGYFNFQFPDTLGSTFLLTGFTEPIFISGNRSRFSVKMSIGMAYLTKVYDPVENPLNKFFSTRISFPLSVALRYKYRVSQSAFLNIAACYNHISNGNIKEPNYGMNYPTLSLGFDYYPKPVPVLEKRYVPDRKINGSPWYFVFETLGAYRSVSEEIYGAFGFSPRIVRYLIPHYSLNAGAEYIVDYSLNKVPEGEDTDYDCSRFALTFGQDFRFGKMVFTQYFGFYLYSPVEPLSFMYQKYEISYPVHKNIILGLFLKATESAAEIGGVHISFVLPV